MANATFSSQLSTEVESFFKAIATESGEWTVKGFIDIYKNIYTISVDTKVVSKIIELMLFPVLLQFAEKNSYKIIPSEHQNHYPDITFVLKDGSKIAVDLKSSYRTSAKRINGFTLGAFTGYFRNRKSDKNIAFPYSDYSAHLVLGIIYSRTKDMDEKKKYSIEDLPNIISVVRDFDFIIHEKWKLASDRPGSGNTKNIGSVKTIEALRSGNGSFAEHGEKIFNDYWMYYLTSDMALKIESTVPYKNLAEYLEWKKR